MKANAPKKIYVHEASAPELTEKLPYHIEYTRTDAFVEKACEFLKDHLAGYNICEDDIERSIESFKLAMKL